MFLFSRTTVGPFRRVGFTSDDLFPFVSYNDSLRGNLYRGALREKDVETGEGEEVSSEK